MEYGERKIKTMVRSILPSKHRHGARFKKKLKHIKDRAHMRQELHRVKFDPDYEIQEIENSDFNANYMVQDRRDADKLSHFERWATQRTANLPTPEARMSYLKSILPQGLIGDHALDHAARWDPFVTDIRFRQTETAKEARRKQNKRARRNKNPQLIASYLDLIFPSLYEMENLNKAIKKAHKLAYNEVILTSKPRLLRGRHDIPDFVKDLIEATKLMVPCKPYTTTKTIQTRFFSLHNKPSHTYTITSHLSEKINPNFHPEWLNCVIEFLDHKFPNWGM